MWTRVSGRFGSALTAPQVLAAAEAAGFCLFSAPGREHVENRDASPPWHGRPFRPLALVASYLHRNVAVKPSK